MFRPSNDLVSQNYQLQPNQPGDSSNPLQQIWTVPLVQPSSQSWNEPPPAYETLTDLPAFVSLPLNPIQNNSQWIRPPAASNDVTSIVPTLPTPPLYSQLHILPSNESTNTAHDINVSSSTLNHPTTNTIDQSSGDRLRKTSPIFKQRYRNGRPKALGILQILVALAQIGTGIALAINEQRGGSQTFSSGIPFWASVFFISTGLTTIAVTGWPSPCKVLGSVLLNIMTLGFAVTGVAISAIDQNNLLCNVVGTSESWCWDMFSSINTIYNILIATYALVSIFSLSAACVGVHALKYTCNETLEETDLGNNIVPSAPSPENI